MNLSKYPGSKTASGIVQWLINNIPLHERYFELFVGSGALYFEKVTAKENYLNDIDTEVTQSLFNAHVATGPTGFYNEDAVDFIKNFQSVNPAGFTRKDFIFLDPPYPASARRSGKPYYRHEMLTDAEHEKLLLSIGDLQANVMIATRENDLYNDMLKGWRKEQFLTADRAGAVYEIVFCNYDRPTILHQYDYLGNGFTDRQRIKRKIKRFSSKIQELPTHEKHLFIQELIQQDAPAVRHFLSMVQGAHRR